MALEKITDPERLKGITKVSPNNNNLEEAVEFAQKLTPQFNTEGLQRITDPNELSYIKERQAKLNDDSWKSTFTDIGVGTFQGLTLGFGDEILTGLGFEEYENQKKISEERSPWTVIGGELAGSLPFFLLPFAGWVRAGAIASKATGGVVNIDQYNKLNKLGRTFYRGGATLAQKGRAGRIATSVPVTYGLEGATYGGLYGIGEGDDIYGDRLTGGAIGAALGGGLVGGIGLGYVGSKAALSGLRSTVATRTGFGQLNTFQNDLDSLVGDILNRQNASALHRERHGKYALNRLFTNEANEYIRPSLSSAYKYLDELPIEITRDGVKTVRKGIPFQFSNITKDLSSIDNSLSNGIFKSNPTFAEAINLRLNALNKASEIGGKQGQQLTRLADSIKTDIFKSVKHLNDPLGLENINRLEKYFDNARKVFNTEIGKRITQSPKLAEELVKDLSNGKFSRADIVDLKKFIKETIRFRDATKVPVTRYTQLYDDLRAEVTHSLLSENPKQLDKILKFDDSRKALRNFLGNSYYERFKDLAYLQRKLQQKGIDTSSRVVEGNQAVELLGAASVGSIGFLTGGFGLAALAAIGYKASTYLGRALIKELLTEPNPKSKRWLRQMAEFLSGKLNKKEESGLRTLTQSMLDDIQKNINQQ